MSLRSPHRARGARPVLLLALIASLMLLRVVPALALFGPIELQSVGPHDQFEAAGEPALSAGGRYLALQGRLDGVEGIYRKDLQTGRIEVVTGAGAFAPSISADGRYVSFTSEGVLVKSVHAEQLNVYVRDMDVPLPAVGEGCSSEEEKRESGKACAYELASALNGGSEDITIAEPEGRHRGPFGAFASGRVALSASGREVAFVVEGESNLASANGGELSTPPMQVAVRYLDTDTTVLVSAERDPVSGQMTGRPVAGGAVTPTTEPGTASPDNRPGAALSADGSTVAWLGAHIPAQAPTLSDERVAIEQDDEKASQNEAYDEPLWRRIADGPQAPTRRIVGGGDPLAPGCPPGGTLAVAACRGPFPGLLGDTRGGLGKHQGWLAFEGYDGVPQLSADGRTVALIGDPRPANAPGGDQGGTSNVFVADMHEGLDRVQALRQLTRGVPVLEVVNPGFHPEYVATAGDVYDIGISPDASRIAFTTQRQQFPLAPPNFTEPPLAQLGMLELYQVNLGTESLQRVTHGPGDGPSLQAGQAVVTGHGAGSPSYSLSDQTLAFADSASNLVSGDTNQASDAYTVTLAEAPGVAGSIEIGALPPAPAPARQWRLSVVPLVRPDGSVVLDVAVPSAGELAATATASVAAGAQRGRLVRSSKTGRSAPRLRIESRERTVASTRRAVGAGGLVELPLKVSPRYAQILRSSAGIYALVRVAFRGSAGPPLSQTLAVSLRAVKKQGRARRQSKPKARSRKTGSR